MQKNKNDYSFSPISLPNKKNVPYANTYAIMMVDPRDKDLHYIINTVEKEIDPSWDFYMFGTNANKNTIENIFKKSKRKLHFFNIPKNFIRSSTNVDYSNFLIDPWIWETIKAEHILLVQTDAAICEQNPSSSINPKKFDKFPYIGCAYNHEEGKNNWWKNPSMDNNIHFYGVGGMSMRRRSFMLKCIHNYRGTSKNVPEDVYFSSCLGVAIKDNNAKPTARDMHKFCSETNYDSKEFGKSTFGVHKPGVSMSLSHMEDLRSICPAAWNVGLKERYKDKKKEKFFNMSFKFN